jgi:hypothetical protein
MTHDESIPRFDRTFFAGKRRLTRLGGGELGGKAGGLARVESMITSELVGELPAGVEVAIPTLAVVATDHFDAFVRDNGLSAVLDDQATDERVAHACQRAELPTSLLGDLRALVEEVRQPLAVRSSSLLEDAVGRPFAGVYTTKMTANRQLDADARFRALAEAIRLVFASTFFRGARDYRRSVGIGEGTEKMAVIVQEVVGHRHGDRFYPDVSGVARSYNYYATGNARPEDGTVSLALGLGKTIVDGDPAWAYSPAYPKSPPPFNSVADLLKSTQTTFWAVHMGAVPYHPTRETEYLIRAGLPEAEADGTLSLLASTYEPESDRLTPGTGRRGPRVLTFAPLLAQSPINDAIRTTMKACEATLGAPVEVEFAVTLGARPESVVRIGFLQVRPLVVPGERVVLSDLDLAGSGVLLAGRRVLGNGEAHDISDVVYVKPATFDATATVAIAGELAAINADLVRAGRPYLLIGFGRWGTSDAWGGVPVTWAQIAGARAIVEAALPTMRGEPSQGSHFFHNVTSFRVLYFSLSGEETVDWGWLECLSAERETTHVRHVRCPAPLLLRVDGCTGKGVIRHDH